MMDNVNDVHYFLRAHVWPSMQNELPHNVVVVLSVISGALFTLLATHVERHLWDVVTTIFVILDQVRKHGAVLTT